MYDHSTKTVSPYHNRSPPSHACRLIPTKNSIIPNLRHKCQGTRQNRGIIKSRKSRKYLQVPRPHLKAPAGTHSRIPASQTYKPYTSSSTKRRGAKVHGASAQGDNGALEPCIVPQSESRHPPLKEPVLIYTEMSTTTYLTLEVYRNLTGAKSRILHTAEPRHLQFGDKHTDTIRGASRYTTRGVTPHLAPHAISLLAPIIPKPQPQISGAPTQQAREAQYPQQHGPIQRSLDTSHAKCIMDKGIST